MSEVQDVIAAVLDEHRMKAPRVQARLVLEAIDGRPRRVKPSASACPRCGEWDAALRSTSVASQAIETADASGSLKPFAAWLLGELLDCRGARGITKAGKP